MKRLFIIFISLFACFIMEASEKDSVTVNLGVDIVDQYIWRGQHLGHVSMQPTLGVGFKGLSLSTWGSMGISNWNDTKELDLTLDYTFKGLNVGLTDYWFSTGNYFQYHNDKTTHVFEGFVGYDFKYVAFKWFTNFAGDDGLNKDGKRAYSSYFELSAPFSFATLDWNASVGMVPWATTFYGNNHFAVTNITLSATKNFEIKKGKCQIPVSAGLTANPDTKKMYLLFGFGFRFGA